MLGVRTEPDLDAPTRRLEPLGGEDGQRLDVPVVRPLITNEDVPTITLPPSGEIPLGPLLLATAGGAPADPQHRRVGGVPGVPRLGDVVLGHTGRVPHTLEVRLEVGDRARQPDRLYEAGEGDQLPLTQDHLHLHRPAAGAGGDGATRTLGERRGDTDHPAPPVPALARELLVPPPHLQRHESAGVVDQVVALARHHLVPAPVLPDADLALGEGGHDHDPVVAGGVEHLEAGAVGDEHRGRRSHGLGRHVVFPLVYLASGLLSSIHPSSLQHLPIKFG